MGILSRFAYSSSHRSITSKPEEDIAKLSQLWEQLVTQIGLVEESVLSFPLRKPSVFQAQNLFFRVVKLVRILEQTAAYAEVVRQEEPSQVENYYPKLIELAEPIKQLIRAFISRKPAIEDLRYLGALEIVSYNLKQINRGYHKLVTDSFDYLPEKLKKEATPIKQGVDDSLTEVLTVYAVST